MPSFRGLFVLLFLLASFLSLSPPLRADPPAFPKGLDEKSLEGASEATLKGWYQDLKARKEHFGKERFARNRVQARLAETKHDQASSWLSKVDHRFFQLQMKKKSAQIEAFQKGPEVRVSKPARVALPKGPKYRERIPKTFDERSLGIRPSEWAKNAKKWFSAAAISEARTNLLGMMQKSLQLAKNPMYKDIEAQLSRRLSTYSRPARHPPEKAQGAPSWSEPVVLAARRGDVEAQVLLGRYFREGKRGFPRDAELGKFWLREAAVAGHPTAASELR